MREVNTWSLQNCCCDDQLADTQTIAILTDPSLYSKKEIVRDPESNMLSIVERFFNEQFCYVCNQETVRLIVLLSHPENTPVRDNDSCCMCLVELIHQLGFRPCKADHHGKRVYHKKITE